MIIGFTGDPPPPLRFCGHLRILVETLPNNVATLARCRQPLNLACLMARYIVQCPHKEGYFYAHIVQGERRGSRPRANRLAREESRVPV